MTTTTDDFSVVENPDQHRFELIRNGELVGFAQYHQRDREVVVPHVETVRHYRGQGYGARLVDGVLEILRADGRTITPLCSFAAGHIGDNAQHHDLLTAC